jgi:hypothetical protein
MVLSDWIRLLLHSNLTNITKYAIVKQNTVSFIQIAGFLQKQSFPNKYTALKMFAKNLARQNFEHLIPQFRLFKKLICVKDTPFMLKFEEFL